jgi:hypothetical protein
MTEIRIGYARCSTDKQDLAAQRAILEELGVTPDRSYTDRGLTGAYSISDLAEFFSVSRPTVYRSLARKVPQS